SQAGGIDLVSRCEASESDVPHGLQDRRRGRLHQASGKAGQLRLRRQEWQRRREERRRLEIPWSRSDAADLSRQLCGVCERHRRRCTEPPGAAGAAEDRCVFRRLVLGQGTPQPVRRSWELQEPDLDHQRQGVGLQRARTLPEARRDAADALPLGQLAGALLTWAIGQPSGTHSPASIAGRGFPPLGEVCFLARRHLANLAEHETDLIGFELWRDGTLVYTLPMPPGYLWNELCQKILAVGFSHRGEQTDIIVLGSCMTAGRDDLSRPLVFSSQGDGFAVDTDLTMATLGLNTIKQVQRKIRAMRQGVH